MSCLTAFPKAVFAFTMACMGERKYGCLPGDRAVRAPQRNIYLLLADGPALARAGLARDGRDGSSLAEGMDRNGVELLLRGLVSALPNSLS